MSVSAIARFLRAELKTSQDLPQIAQALARCAVQCLGVAIARVDYRHGEKTLSELASSSAVPSDIAARLSTRLLDGLCVEVQTDQDQSPKMKAFRRADQTMTVFASPINELSSGIPEGALAFMLPGLTDQADVFLTIVDSMTTIAALRLAELAVAELAAEAARKPMIPEQPAADAVPTNPPSAALGRMAANGSPREFAFSLVNSLANQLGAEQIGFGQNQAARIHVLAISSLPDFKANSPGVVLMQQAMEECLDHGRLIVHQTGVTSTDGTEFAIHRRWSAETGGACLLSIPLTDSEGVVAVVSLRRPGTRPFTKEEIAGVMQILQPQGAALRIFERATRTVSQQLKTSVRETTQKVLGPKSYGRKVAVMVLLAAVLWCLFGTLTYTPLCHARVVAENMIQMTAPFDGKLLAVHVLPGQTVKAGQLLAEFETTELALQLQTLDRDIVSSEIEVRRAIAGKDTGAAALAKARVGVLMTQAASVQQRIENARVVAPQDGTVVRADLEKRIGQIFSTGESVVEYAPFGGWVLEIEVPDDVGSLVKPQQTGTFAAASLTSHSMPFQIASLEGTAQVMDGRNIFIARAPLGEQPEWMKSGMEGTAKVTTVAKPVWWVALHRMIDWFRLSFWI